MPTLDNIKHSRLSVLERRRRQLDTDILEKKELKTIKLSKEGYYELQEWDDGSIIIVPRKWFDKFSELNSCRLPGQWY